MFKTELIETAPSFRANFAKSQLLLLPVPSKVHEAGSYSLGIRYSTIQSILKSPAQIFGCKITIVLQFQQQDFAKQFSFSQFWMEILSSDSVLICPIVFLINLSFTCQKLRALRTLGRRTKIPKEIQYHEIISEKETVQCFARQWCSRMILT